MANSKHFKNTNTSLFLNVKNVFYWLILSRKIFCSLKNDTTQMFLGLFAEINDVESVRVKLAQGRTESDEYTTRCHYDSIFLFLSQTQ